MCVLAGINQLGFGGVVPALPLYGKSFGVSASAIGMAVGIVGLARFCGAIPAGWLSDGLEETRDIGRAAGATRNRAGGSFLAGVAMVWKQTGLVLACLVSMANAAARTGGLFAIVPVLGVVGLGLSATDVGFALAVGTVVGLLASYPGEMPTDYFGRKAASVAFLASLHAGYSAGTVIPVDGGMSRFAMQYQPALNY
jgi:MFS family permease